jgi:hypothetical protein
MLGVEGLPTRRATPTSPLPARAFTYAEAIAAGYPRGLIRHLVHTGRWLALRRGVFCDAALAERADPTWLASGAALLVMAPGAAISHESAACLHDLATVAAPSVVWLTRPRTSRHGRHSHPGIVERSAALPSDHVTRVRGLPVTTAARTVVDLARYRSFADAVILMDAVLQQGATTPAELLAVRVSCEAWPGISRAATALSFADGAAESPLESHSRIAFAQGGLPTPTLQAEIRLLDGRVVRVDFLWTQWRVIGEADGRLKYEKPEDLWREKLREDGLRELGYEVVRWTWDEVLYRPEVVVARILRAAERARRHA